MDKAGLRILLIGKNGQVGYELKRTLAPLGEVIALDQADFDLTLPDRIRERIREIEPGLIVNAAAYTAVDQAEDNPKLAMAVNGTAPGILAEEANRINATLVHYSTDYVFGDEAEIGRSSAFPNTPYTEAVEPHPLSVYGKAKLAGERAIQAVGKSYIILRTSWVYGLRGNNFLLTMLRLAETKKELKVVDDQMGAPTSSAMLAEATARILSRFLSEASLKEISGLYHLTAAGQTSWYQFAKAIFKHHTPRRSIMKRLIPIPTADYPTPAKRPRFSLLDCTKVCQAFGVTLPHWEEGLAMILREKNEG